MCYYEKSFQINKALFNDCLIIYNYLSLKNKATEKKHTRGANQWLLLIDVCKERGLLLVPPQQTFQRCFNFAFWLI